jgi:putative membrane protein (TIGR04086 family)
MRKNVKPSGRASSIWGGVFAGVVLALAITLLGAFVMAVLLDAQIVDAEKIGYGSMVILILSTSAGSWLASAMVKHRVLMVCSMVGGCYYGSLLAITALFFGGQYRGMGVTAILIFGSSLAVGFLKGRPKGTITKGYRKLQAG